MDFVIVTAPTIEPVTVNEVKDYLRVDTNVDDSLIADLISSAREEVEDWTRRKMMVQTWDYYLDAFPQKNYIILPFGRLNSVTSVKWKDTDGTETTLVENTDYLVETNGDQLGKIILPYGETWPSGPFYTTHAIVIRFVCGWTAMSSVPGKIRTAIKLRVAARYEDRGESVVGQTVVENKAAEMLIASERLWWCFQ